MVQSSAILRNALETLSALGSLPRVRRDHLPEVSFARHDVLLHHLHGLSCCDPCLVLEAEEALPEAMAIFLGELGLHFKLCCQLLFRDQHAVVIGFYLHL